ncbi:DUF3267 domain-containing protein [Dapis sp. BLCC M229]|uniref:DUF3267 domain-containing protein n=1 Tax=Dapis sp. BLCC M229 TaxID=3400188 RepID=UPI003CF1F792
MKNNTAIPIGIGSLFAIIVGLLPVILMMEIYLKIWGINSLISGLQSFCSNPIDFLIVIATGIILHELIHGLSWQLLAGKKASAIKYGFDWKTLTPYAHCRESMTVESYRLGTAMPGILLGLVPVISSIFTSNGWLFCFGIFFTFAAGGDLLILWLVRSLKAGTLVKDHPSKFGCYIIS